MGPVESKSKSRKKSKQSTSFLKYFIPEWRTEVLAILGLLVVLALVRFKTLINIDSLFLGSIDGDAGLYVWLMRTNIRDLLELPWFSKTAFYPYAQSMAWSDNFILPSLIATPLFNHGASNQLAFNLIILLSTFLNGYFTFRLCFRITGDGVSSFAGGIIFMTIPYLSFQLGHPQLQFFFFIPLSFIFLFSYFAKRRIIDGIGIGLCMFLSFLCCIYYTIYIAIALAIIFTLTLLLKPRAFSTFEIFKLATSIVVGLIPVIPFLIPYLAVQDTFGERKLYEAYKFAASAWSYFSSPPESFIYSITSSFTHSEAYLFPGLVILALASQSFVRLSEAKPLASIAHKLLLTVILSMTFSFVNHSTNQLGWPRFATALSFWLSLYYLARLAITLGQLEIKLGFPTLTQRNMICIFSGLALVFMIFSFGPLGNPEKKHIALSPFRFVFDYVPGISAVRAVSRYGIMTSFSLVILAVFAISKMRTSAKLRSVAMVALIAAMVENVQTSYPLSSPQPPPDIFRMLPELESTRAAAIALPFAGQLKPTGEIDSWSQYAKLNLTYLLWAQDSMMPLVNGYSGQTTKLMNDLPRALKDFPSIRAMKKLASIAGLRYVIYNSRLVPKFDASVFHKQMRELEPNLRIISNDDWGTYLIELDDESTVDGEFELIIPAKEEGILSFELRTGFEAHEDEIAIDVYLQEGSFPILLNTVHVPGDGGWVTIPISIPKGINPVRTRKVSFEVHGETAIYLQKSIFLPARN